MMDRISTELLDDELQKAKEHRQAIWRRIQTEAPEVAELLTEINREFGKPSAVKVIINNETVLDKGEYLPRRR